MPSFATLAKPVAGLQGVDFYKKWGRQELDVPQPFEARYIRIRFHNDGQRVVALKYPAEFHVCCGTADETWAFPPAGPVVAEGKLAVVVFKSFFVLSIAIDRIR